MEGMDGGEIGADDRHGTVGRGSSGACERVRFRERCKTFDARCRVRMIARQKRVSCVVSTGSLDVSRCNPQECWRLEDVEAVSADWTGAHSSGQRASGRCRDPRMERSECYYGGVVLQQ